MASISERKREAGTQLEDASSARNGVVDIQMMMIENMEIERYEQGIFLKQFYGRNNLSVCFSTTLKDPFSPSILSFCCT